MIRTYKAGLSGFLAKTIFIKLIVVAFMVQVLMGHLAVQAGDNNHVLSLDGNGAYVAIPYAPDLNLTNFTLEAWINASSTNSGEHAIIGKQYSLWRTGYRLGLFGSTPDVGADDGIITPPVTFSTQDISARTWHHICATYNSSEFKIYVDGFLTGSKTSNIQLPSSSFPLYLGQENIGGVDKRYFSGMIDDVRIWSTARSQEEIQRNMLSRLTGTEPNLVAYWNFDDGTANDMSGHGHSGTFTGGATTIPEALFPADSVAPTITQEPQSQTNTVGANVTFTVVATGTLPLTYQWKFNAGAITGATSASITLNSVSSANSGSYTVDVSNGVKTVTSASAILTLKTPVSITQQPQNQAVVEGGKVTFTAVAAGSPPLTYQWRTNGIPISGAAAASLTLLNVQPSESGTYSLVVANPWSTATSAASVLAVLIQSNGEPYQTNLTKVTDGLLAQFRLDGSDPELYFQADKAQYVADRLGENHSAMKFPESGFVGSLERDFFKNRTQWSWAGWIQPENAMPHQVIYSEGNRGASGYIGIDANRVFVGLWNENVATGWTTCFTPAIIRNGAWQHLAVTFDASTNQTGVCRVYVNGAQVLSSVLPMEKATDAFRLSNHDFCLGDDIAAYNSVGHVAHNGFSGSLDDVLIYSRVLSPADIDTLAHSPNGVLNLTGKADYASITSTPSLQNSNAITIEAWIYSVPNTNNTTAYFLSKGDGGNPNSPATYALYWSPDNRAYFSLFTGKSTWSLLGASVAESQWTHIAATFNSADGWLKLYTNGVMAAATTNDVTGQFSLAGQYLRQTSSPLVFGCSFDGQPVGETYGTGQMDEVCVWNRALSGQEILNNISKRLSSSQLNLVGYWNFDNGSPNDGSKNSYSGTLAGDGQIVAMEGFDIIHDVVGFTGTSFDRRGQIMLEITARIGVNIRVDASTNMIDWVPVGTFQNTAGIVQFTDVDTLKYGQRFYRAVLP